MSNNNKITHDYFIPHLRTGLAARIPDSDDDGKRTTIPVSLDISSKDKNGKLVKTVKQQLALYGAGDVIGFDASAVLQITPNQNTPHFRADLIPYIEFKSPDFLWRYSSAKANNNNNWIPWLSLIVLKNASEIEGGEFSLIPQSEKLLAPCIQLSHNAILPDLNESWRWAHIHLNAEGGITDPAVLQNIIQTSPQKAASRLMAPRRLKTKTKYTAFVIPTYQLGVLAAKGESGLQTGTSNNRKTLAWKTPKDAQGKIIPYYYKWSFQTGERGDFEYLIRKLEHRKLEQVGQRSLDCSEVGYGLSAKPATLKMESALQSPDIEYQSHGLDGNGFTSDQKELTKLLNKGNKNNELTLAPPTYGRWYQSAEGTDFQLDNTPKSKSNWIAELNLDYRHRAAAGLGVQFVKENQEALMQSAWRQLAEVKKVNRQLNYARFGRAVSSCLYKKINSLEEEQLVRLGLPVQSKVAMDTLSLKSQLSKIEIPKPLLATKIKKFLVPKFEPKNPPIASNETPTNTGTGTNTGTSSGTTPTPIPTVPSAIVTFKKARTGFGLNKTSTNLSKSNTRTRSLGGKVLSTKNHPKTILNKASNLLSNQLNPKISIEKRWAKKVEKFHQWKKLSRPDISENNAAPFMPPDPLESILWYPEFPIPMNQYLKDKSSDFLLAGLNHVPANTISLLETNQRFIEAFMLGANHEMAAELRWRKFPTDMKGSYFTKFWDSTIYSVSDVEKQKFHNSALAKKLLLHLKSLGINDFNKMSAIYDQPVQDLSDKDRQAMEAYEQVLEKWLLTQPNQQDIASIANWAKDKRLGFNSLSVNSPNEDVDNANQLVLLLRSDILQKAPSTLFYLAPKIGTDNNAIPDYQTKLFPIFEGTFPPDLVFFGFKIKVNEYKNYFLVFEEPMSQTNFGLDEESPLEATNTAANVSWQHFQNLDAEGYLNGDIPQNINSDHWNNPAFIAKVCTQKSVRLAVPLSRFFGT